MTSDLRRFVVHPSVLAVLWQYPGPLYDAAHALLEELARGSLRLLAVEGIELHVLELLAVYLRDDRIEPLISVPLFMDVKAQIALMTNHHLMEIVGAEGLTGSAFVIATRYALSVHDTLAVALAERAGHMLLVGDEQLRDQLTRLAHERTQLQVAWLRD